MPDGSAHWALCDTESAKDGKVSCAYLVLLADYPTCSDGLPVSEQPLPKRIVELLNRHGYSAAAKRWTCESCGCEFPAIPGDDDVKRCSSCVKIEVLHGLNQELRGHFEKFAGFVATCRRENTAEWMRLLLDWLNGVATRLDPSVYFEIVNEEHIVMRQENTHAESDSPAGG